MRGADKTIEDTAEIEDIIDGAIVKGAVPCEWSMRYRSVIGYGTASIVEVTDEKRKALDAIVARYAGRSREVPEDRTRGVAVIKVVIERMTGRRAGC